MNKIIIRECTSEISGVCTYNVIAIEDKLINLGNTVSVKIELSKEGYQWKIEEQGHNRSGLCEDVNDIVPDLSKRAGMPESDYYVILLAGTYYSPDAVFNNYFTKERFEVVVE